MPPANHILLIDCPDETGLVYKITGVLYRHSYNIVTNNEFVDREARHFFMRTEFAGDVNPAIVLDELRALLPAGANLRLANTGKRRIVVLATKEYHCLGDLLIRHAYAELNAEMLAVISNHDILAGLAQKFDVPFHAVSHANMERPAHEAAIAQLIEQYDPEYIVLAKYMRILSPAFVARYPNKIINIHHSFLPAFIGASPYRQAFERGVKLIGATAHFVTDDLDKGPIIAQDVIRIDHTYNPNDLAQIGHDVEKITLAKALKLVFEERIFLSGNRAIIFE
jgi:formyltetrahydrofolate deformylase